MKTTFHGHKDLTALFSLKEASRATLSAKEDNGFVTSKRFPGVAWLKALSKDERTKNREIRAELAQRLRLISGSSDSMDVTGHSSKVLNRVIKMLNKGSGRPLSTKYLTRLCSRASFLTGNAKERWTSIKTTIIYKLLGGMVAGKYRDYVVRKEGAGPGAFQKWLLKQKAKHSPENQDMKNWAEQFKVEFPTDANLPRDRASSIILED